MAAKGLALVTGASNGIGYQLALQLAQDGYDLVIAGKQQDLTAKAEAAFKAHGVEVSSYVGDLSQFQANMDLWHLVTIGQSPARHRLYQCRPRRRWRFHHDLA